MDYYSTTAGASLATHHSPESSKIVAWAHPVRLVGNPEAIHLDVVANPWNGRGIWREHRSNLRALCGDIGHSARQGHPGQWPCRAMSSWGKFPESPLVHNLLAGVRNFRT